MFVSLKFYIQVVEVLHTRSAKNSTVSFYHFLEKLKMP